MEKNGLAARVMERFALKASDGRGVCFVSDDDLNLLAEIAMLEQGRDDLLKRIEIACNSLRALDDVGRLTKADKIVVRGVYTILRAALGGDDE